VTATDHIATMVGELDKQGVTVGYAPLGDKVAEWDGPRGTFTVDQSAAEMDQVWALTQMWICMVAGPSASGGVVDEIFPVE
jgi:hypothetical protein